MPTKIYGWSDREQKGLVVEGDVEGDIACGAPVPHDGSGVGIILYCNDGTLIEAVFGRVTPGAWSLHVLRQGSLFRRHMPYEPDDSLFYSDVILFEDGLNSVSVPKEWEIVA